MKGDYLFRSEPTVADCYLFVMLTWSNKFSVTVPAALNVFKDRMLTRPAVISAMQHEGLR